MEIDNKPSLTPLLLGQSATQKSKDHRHQSPTLGFRGVPQKEAWKQVTERGYVKQEPEEREYLWMNDAETWKFKGCFY